VSQVIAGPSPREYPALAVRAWKGYLLRSPNDHWNRIVIYRVGRRTPIEHFSAIAAFLGDEQNCFAAEGARPFFALGRLDQLDISRLHRAARWAELPAACRALKHGVWTFPHEGNFSEATVRT
jgi:hypothetical protein